MAYAAPTTFTTGHKVTAAEWNQDVRDNGSELYARVNKRGMIITCFHETAAVITNNSTPIKTIYIPLEFNNAVLSRVAAAVHGVSSSGAVTVRIYNATDTVNMLTTNITIDQSERTSNTAATAAVINTTYDDVVTDDRIAIYVVGAGTGTLGLDVTLTFQLP